MIMDRQLHWEPKRWSVLLQSERSLVDLGVGVDAIVERRRLQY